MANTHYCIDGTLSAKFGETQTTAQFALGTTARGNSGTEWVYVQADGAITQYHAVAIDEDYQAKSLTKALADVNHKVGFAQVAFADNEYGWVATRGSGINVLVKASCAADVDLYTTASAGVLDDATSSQTKITGVVVITAATASGTQAEEALATFPIAAA